jgi:SAM-dependent methyltransferase
LSSLKDQRLQEQTIKDFGEQWTTYRANRGYYASVELFQDLFAPLVQLDEIKGCRVAEIGSGTGRVVRMLLDAGAAHVLAVEPSGAFSVLQQNTQAHSERVTLLQVTGDKIPATADRDWVFSVGVLHHIPDPAPVVRAACAALRPGGRMGVWLYAREGNRLLLAFLLPLRAVTKRLPHFLLSGLVWLLYLPLLVYMGLCKFLPLPLGPYLKQQLGRFGGAEQRLVIYDQLNPAYAKYYTREEAWKLLAAAGFDDIRAHHRHGYSWTVVGTKPLV